jgi:hypothetical protein
LNTGVISYYGIDELTRISNSSVCNQVPDTTSSVSPQVFTVYDNCLKFMVLGDKDALYGLCS